MEFVETNWLLILIVAALAAAIAWYIFHAARRTGVTATRRDVLDEGAAPAARNQALIDAPRSGAGLATTNAAPSAEPAPFPIPPAAPAGLAGVREAVQAAAEPVPIVAQPDGHDDFTRIKGIGPKLAAQLEAMGVRSFAEIAGWSESDIDRVDAQLGRFQGRIRRDNWPEQARLLAAGDQAGFATRFGAIS